MYLENRCAEVVVAKPNQDEVALGLFGILRPDVLANFDIRNGLAGALHLNVEDLFPLYDL
jgi:phenylalanyl-tRNA synthetase beta subunit